MEIITGYTGKPHVTSDQGRDVNIGIMGEGSYVLQTGMQLAAEVSSNNEIKIRDGVLMHQGCTASIKKNTYDSLAITNGSQGMKRVDLIVARYEKNRVNGIESIDLKVIQGTPAESNPAAPQCIEGDIQAGDYVADMPMYQVIIEGLNITEVKEMFKVIGSNKDLTDKLGLQMLLNTDEQQIYTMYGGQIKVVSGTKVVNINMNAGYALLFGVDELKALFGDNYASTRLAMNTYNADTIAQAVHFYAPEIWNREVYQYFYPINHSGNMRINYKLEYVYDFEN
ncbi:hypothetical protein [Dorea amylophila]|uniref:hypothetical protein n=1 Tax=Dorea amylophila TaxID=2981789 RepID=UPI0022E77043|nr:hypothetical protein [Dorea amylophila]